MVLERGLGTEKEQAEKKEFEAGLVMLCLPKSVVVYLCWKCRRD